MLQLIFALAAAAPAAGHVIVNPDWAVRPSGDEFVWYYPPAAMVSGVGGRATVRCRVKLDGSTTDCSVVSEDPPGFGFGQAALAAAARFRLKPQTVDGKPTDQGEVVVPVHFPKAGDRGDLALARRCAGWAQATQQAMAAPDAQFPSWAYVFWRFRFTAFAVASGMKPSEITKAVEEGAKWAAGSRMDGAKYGDCVNDALMAWPHRPFVRVTQ